MITDMFVMAIFGTFIVAVPKRYRREISGVSNILFQLFAEVKFIIKLITGVISMVFNDMVFIIDIVKVMAETNFILYNLIVSVRPNKAVIDATIGMSMWMISIQVDSNDIPFATRVKTLLFSMFKIKSAILSPYALVIENVKAAIANSTVVSA